jgi:hypothetical protein
MATTDERAERVPAAKAEPSRPPRDEAARARAYLDLWERHLTQSAIDGPIQPGRRQPA